MVVATNKCTSVAGHYDGHAETLKQYMWHRPMQHVQGYSGSHWTLPSGDYSLLIASVATRVTSNKTLMAIAMRRYYTTHIARWRRFLAFVKATGRALALILPISIGHANAGCFLHFIMKKGNKCLNNNIIYLPPQLSIHLFYFSSSHQFDMSYPYCY